MSGRAPILVLNVAEKPSVVKSVSEILSRGGGGGMRSREGRSRYNRVFEFDYSIGGRNCHMLFTSVTGHLMELEFDERYRKWHSCDPAELYSAPVRKSVPQKAVDERSILHCRDDGNVLVILAFAMLGALIWQVAKSVTTSSQ